MKTDTGALSLQKIYICFEVVFRWRREKAYTENKEFKPLSFMHNYLLIT